MKKTLIFLLALSGSLIGGEEWRSLFDGETLTGWTNPKGEPAKEGGWIAKDGVLYRKSLAGDLLTKERFRDFEFSFEWKISEGGNSGVKYRVREDRLGLEYQILDDEKHPDGKKLSRQSAALYDLKATIADKGLKPPGEWNKGRILVRDGVVKHYLNGKLVVELAIPSEEWEQRYAESKYTKHEGFGLNEEGRILLQDHRDDVWFRHLKIRTFEAK
ncbi:MAG: DUF1080 domain-containing protein [Verrucomicrobiota bacterium JB023]|nr:DUF1080 domain-containing protein [Verrucomicrobiota bacterium JB023]